jgi:hypothetical protein
VTITTEVLIVEEIPYTIEVNEMDDGLIIVETGVTE